MKAIEHFLSAQDTILAQHQNVQNQNSQTHGYGNVRNTDTSINSFHPYMAAFNQFRPGIHGQNKVPLNNNLKSAFTPLSHHVSPYANMHLALNHRNSMFAGENLFNKMTSGLANPLFPSNPPISRPNDMLNNNNSLQRTPFNFAQLPLLASQQFGFSSLLSSRHAASLESSHSEKTTDFDQKSDSWTESPGKDKDQSD